MCKIMHCGLFILLEITQFFSIIITRLQDAATQRFPPSTQAFILEVRKARDAAMGDLEKVKKERDQLREKFRVSASG